MGNWTNLLHLVRALFVGFPTFGSTPYSNHAICWKPGQKYPYLRMQPCILDDLSTLEGCPRYKGGQLYRKWHKLGNAGEWRAAFKKLGNKS